MGTLCFQACASLRLASVQTRSVWDGKTPLEQDDPDMMNILKKEKDRQTRGLELIASEVNIIN